MVVFSDHDRVSEWGLELNKGQNTSTQTTPATEVWLIYGLRRAVLAIPVPQSNQNESPETEVPSSPVSLSKLAMVLRRRK